jgi:hypothetical protein
MIGPKLIAVVGAVSVWTLPAWAAMSDGASPPGLPDNIPWKVLGYAAAIAATALAVAFKSTRRTHLD